MNSKLENLVTMWNSTHSDDCQMTVEEIITEVGNVQGLTRQSIYDQAMSLDDYSSEEFDAMVAENLKTMVVVA